MASQTDIVNLAFALVGEEKINNIDDPGNKSAVWAKTVFNQSRDEILSLPYDWYPFRTRAELSQVDAPDFGRYAYAYAFPDNYIRTIATIDVDEDEIVFQYRRETRVITDSQNRQQALKILLTNEENVYMKYIVRITDTAFWPAWFTKMVYTNIAFKISAPLKQIDGFRVSIFTLLQDAITEGIQANNAEDMDVDDNYQDLDKGNTDVSDAAGIVNSLRLKKVNRT